MNTTQGPIVIQLHPEIAPVTVNNFIVLAIHGYYNGLIVLGQRGLGGPGRRPTATGVAARATPCPTSPTPTPAGTWGGRHGTGTRSAPVNGSQFFIEKAAWPGTGPTAVYNRFGTVISGMDKAQLIQPTDTITSITIKVSLTPR